MNTPGPMNCGAFRARLAGELEAHPGGLEVARIGWHSQIAEHLATCLGCRALLEAEEALEMLLSSMPEPSLPAELATRVLARLRDGADPLDRLLGLEPAPSAPADLAAGVLASVRARREAEEAQLDRVLEHGRAVEVPAGLSARVLAGLHAREALAEDVVVPRPAFVNRARLRRVAGWSGALAAGLLGVLLWRAAAPGAAYPDDEVLENLALLEFWDRVQDENGGFAIDTLHYIQPGDELLMDLGAH